MTPHVVTEQLIQSNLRGRGGAVFPTGPKASLIPPPDKVAKPIPLTVNAAEREPGEVKGRDETMTGTAPRGARVGVPARTRG